MKFGDATFSRSLRRHVRTAVNAEPRLQRERRVARKSARRVLRSPFFIRLVLATIGVTLLAAQPDGAARLVGLGAWWWLACVLHRSGALLNWLQRGPAWVHALAYPVPPERQWPVIEREVLRGAAWTVAEFAIAFALVTGARLSGEAWLRALLFGANLGWLALGATFAIGAALRARWAGLVQGAGAAVGLGLFGGLWLGDKLPAVREQFAEPFAALLGHFTPAGVLTQVALSHATLDLETLGAAVVLLTAIAVATWWAWNEFRGRMLVALRVQVAEAEAESLGGIVDSNDPGPPPEAESPAATEPPGETSGAASPAQVDSPTTRDIAGVEQRLREALAAEPAHRLAGRSRFIAWILAGLAPRTRFLTTAVWRELPAWQRTGTWAAAIIVATWAANRVLAPVGVPPGPERWGGPMIIGLVFLLLRTVPIFTTGWRVFATSGATNRGVPWLAFQPIGYGELSRAILAVEIRRTFAAWPWLAVFAGVCADGFAMGWEMWLGLPTLVVAAFVAVQPVRVVFAFSRDSRDTRTKPGGAFVLALVFGGLFALACIPIAIALLGPWGALVGVVLLNAFSFAMWTIYGRLYRRARWDLVGEAR